MTNMNIYAHEMDEATTLVKKTALKLHEIECAKALLAQLQDEVIDLEHQMTLNDALLHHLENGGMTHNGWYFYAEQKGIGKSVYHEPCTKMSTIEALKGVAA